MAVTERATEVEKLAELLAAADLMVEAHDEDVYFDPSPQFDGEVERVARCEQARERLRGAVKAVKGGA